MYEALMISISKHTIIFNLLIKSIINLNYFHSFNISDNYKSDTTSLKDKIRPDVIKNVVAPSALNNGASMTAANRKGILKNNQTKALEKLDKMVEEINDPSLPGMCPLNFLQPIPHSFSYSSPSPDDIDESISPPPPPNSKSDNNLYMTSQRNHIVENTKTGHTHNHRFHHNQHNHHRIATSQSFTHQKDMQCCTGYAHHPPTRHHRIHSHACQII